MRLSSAPQLGAPPRSLTTGVYTRLRADILACRLRPGAKFKINELCGEYGVSLGAVREALSRLTSDGLVVAEAQKGFQVAPVSTADLIDLTEARLEIEALCLRRAIAVGDVAWEARVLSVAHRLAREPEREADDPVRLSEAWSALHAEFHATLVGGSDNRWLLRLRAVLYDQSERYRRLSTPLADVTRDIEGEHRAIVEAAVARESETAVMRLCDHLRLTTSVLIEAGVASGA